MQRAAPAVCVAQRAETSGASSSPNKSAPAARACARAIATSGKVQRGAHLRHSQRGIDALFFAAKRDAVHKVECDAVHAIGKKVGNGSGARDVAAAGVVSKWSAPAGQ